jgi:hypothetical protein
MLYKKTWLAHDNGISRSPFCFVEEEMPKQFCTNFLVITVFALLFGAYAHAWASTLPPATGFSQILIHGEQNGGATVPSAASLTLGDSSGSAFISGAPDPSVQAYAGNGDGLNPALADAYESYYVEALGPGVQAIPLVVQASIFTLASSNTQSSGGASGCLSINGPYCTGSNAVNLANSNTGHNSNIEDFTQRLSVTPGTLTTISMSVSTLENVQGFASAIVDPYVYIDPTWLAANPGYSLEFSPGIGNEAPSTPLPAALPLFASALGGLGGTAWLRRRA